MEGPSYYRQAIEAARAVIGIASQSSLGLPSAFRGNLTIKILKTVAYKRLTNAG